MGRYRVSVKYSIELLSNKSKVIKKFWIHKGVRRKLFLDKQRIWNVKLTDTNKPLENKFTLRQKMLPYFCDGYVPKAFFGIRTATQVKKILTIGRKTWVICAFGG